jgi:hypothetical protein
MPPCSQTLARVEKKGAATNKRTLQRQPLKKTLETTRKRSLESEAFSFPN